MSKVFYPEIRADHPVLGSVMSPQTEVRLLGPEWDSVVVTNSLGFRDGEHDLRCDVRRIVWLGDSVVAAIRCPQEDTFPHLIGPRLSAQTIAIACGGWCQREQYRAYQIYGRQFQATAVVLVIYAHNDLIENPTRMFAGENQPSIDNDELDQNILDEYRLAPLASQRTGELKNAGTVGQPDSLMEGLQSQLRAQRRVKALAYGLGLAASPYPTWPDMYGGMAMFECYQTHLSPPWKKHYDLLLEYVTRLRGRVEGAGSKFVAVIYPSPWQVTDASWSELTMRFPDLGRQHDRQAPMRHLRERFDKASVTYVDLLEMMDGADAREFYFRCVDHLNQRGEALVADLLAPKLSAHLDAAE
ncbi:MAG TPA: hypothetical protein VHZ24_21825 [Pirellulales bacterium]|jgi:hypothetical protein|nr:hypothetical protein [Pirellulales bacterium]